MSKFFLSSGAILGGLGVVFGAYASHGLKSHISSEMYSSFQTGLHYQMIHSILLLITGILCRIHPSVFFRISGLLIFAGIFLFSFTIYLHAGFNFSVTFLTPAGGMSLIGGWFFLFVSAMQMKHDVVKKG